MFIKPNGLFSYDGTNQFMGCQKSTKVSVETWPWSKDYRCWWGANAIQILYGEPTELGPE